MSERRARRLPSIIMLGLIVIAIFAFTAGPVHNESTAEEVREQRQVHLVQAAETESEPQTERQTETEPQTEPQTETEPETETETETEYVRYFDPDDEVILRKLAMAEAEGEGTEGKALVMMVVLNRVDSGDFPGTISEVVYDPGQFSVMVDGGRYWSTEPDEECEDALQMIREGWDGSDGALYFASLYADASWQENNLEYLFTVGGHRFYR